MSRKNPLDHVLAQIATDQQQADAERQRQEQQAKVAASNAHYDALQFVLAVQHAAENAALRARLGGGGQTGL